jgi:copper chaperone NosL
MNKVLVFLLLFLVACQPKPKVIVYGQDECHYCKMMIMENQYGTELVTTKSKIYKFDSVECLIDFAQKGEMPDADIAMELVTTFNQPGELKDAKQSYFLHSENLPSPMGMYLTAFDSEIAALEAQVKYGGEVYDWEKLKLNFKSLK